LLLLRMTGLRDNKTPRSTSSSSQREARSKTTPGIASSRPAGALWASALVAALFAWHPLHVESVAWAAERKDVLSTFFELLALIFYVRYAQKRSRVESRESNATAKSLALDLRRSTRDYSLALLFFALALMAKPMPVTVPFVFLLLDYWPLRRISDLRSKATRHSSLLLEKIPFFALSAISCVVTYLSQRAEAVQSLDRYPLDLRVGNALLSYGRYLWKAIWPVNLAIIYPFPKQLPWTEVGLVAAALVVLSWLVWRARGRCPYWLVGWLWFLGTLVPVIGLVQVGHQAMADRYAYFPLTGIFIGVAFGMADWAGRSKFKNAAVAVVGILMLGGCLLGTENQLRYWRDDETLFAHAVAVTKNNALARLHLGEAREQQSRLDDALAQFQEVLRFDPNNAEAHLNAGAVIARMGRLDEAIAHYQTALEIRPGFAEAQYNIGTALFQNGRVNEAIASFRKALEMRPGYADALCNLGAAYLQQGRLEDAIAQYQQAVALQPGSAEAHNNLGYALLQKGRVREAIAHYETSLELQPDNPDTQNILAWVLATSPDASDQSKVRAIALAEQANRLAGGTNPVMIETLAAAYAGAGRFPEAIAAVRTAVQLAGAQSNAPLVETLQSQIKFYQAGQPFRNTARPDVVPALNRP